METEAARARQYLSQELGISSDDLAALAPELLVAMATQVRRQQGDR
ncbi:MAG TPA: hypothetical protein VNI34_01855 [Candidatus Nitrosotalea sp.]|nr:hypothetical protein [Candidatus Nitrosotalea sp.]